MRSLLCLAVAVVSLLNFPARGAEIHEAAKTGDVSALVAALDAGANINELDESRQATPLYFAVQNGHVEAAALLLTRGADVNLSSKWGGPPLFRAAWKGHRELLALLLANGADPLAAFNTETALHKASDSGCLDCVKLLIDAGADVMALNDKGQPPIHYAVSKGHRAIADHLRASGYAPPTIPPIAAKLQYGDSQKGEAIFGKCRNCHDNTKKMLSTYGPPMWGIIGRPIASIPGFNYSNAFESREGTWNFETFNAFIAAPTLARPGINQMWATEGVPDEADRIHLIAYLRLLSDAPVPLPE
jgi:cytochrome c